MKRSTRTANRAGWHDIPEPVLLAILEMLDDTALALVVRASKNAVPHGDRFTEMAKRRREAFFAFGGCKVGWKLTLLHARLRAMVSRAATPERVPALVISAPRRSGSTTFLAMMAVDELHRGMRSHASDPKSEPPVIVYYAADQRNGSRFVSMVSDLMSDEMSKSVVSRAQWSLVTASGGRLTCSCRSYENRPGPATLILAEPVEEMTCAIAMAMSQCAPSSRTIIAHACAGIYPGEDVLPDRSDSMTAIAARFKRISRRARRMIKKGKHCTCGVCAVAGREPDDVMIARVTRSPGVGIQTRMIRNRSAPSRAPPPPSACADWHILNVDTQLLVADYLDAHAMKAMACASKDAIPRCDKRDAITRRVRVEYRYEFPDGCAAHWRPVRSQRRLRVDVRRFAAANIRGADGKPIDESRYNLVMFVPEFCGAMVMLAFEALEELARHALARTHAARIVYHTDSTANGEAFLGIVQTRMSAWLRRAVIEPKGRRPLVETKLDTLHGSVVVHGPGESRADALDLEPPTLELARHYRTVEIDRAIARSANGISRFVVAQSHAECDLALAALLRNSIIPVAKSRAAELMAVDARGRRNLDAGYRESAPLKTLLQTAYALDASAPLLVETVIV